MYPGRITRGVISITTGDSRKGCLGQFFVFSVCMYVCVYSAGISRVLIKYSSKYVKIYFNMKITYYEGLALELLHA